MALKNILNKVFFVKINRGETEKNFQEESKKVLVTAQGTLVNDVTHWKGEGAQWAQLESNVQYLQLSK